jgi:hypothetical protein
MPCDTRLKPKQTISERAAEIRKAVLNIDRLLLRRAVRPVVDRVTGAIAFAGIPEDVRDGLTDACIFRRILATGSALARAEITRAEQMAGRGVNKQAVATGVHSHDGGRSWHQWPLKQ